MRKRSTLFWFAALAAGAAFTLSASCVTKPLRARRVTAETAAVDLFGGSDASGGVGDWVLTNGLIEAVIDDVGYQADMLAAGEPVPIQNVVGRSGGMLIDLGRYGADDDQLALLLPILAYNVELPMKAIPAYDELGDPSLASIVANVDTTAGEASLTVYGRALAVSGLPLALQPLAFQQRYSVRRGETFLRILTEVRNADPFWFHTVNAVSDAMILGPGGPMPFAPYPGRGFNLVSGAAHLPFLSTFGLLGPNDGPVHESGSAAREVSYTLAAPDDERGPYVYSQATDGIVTAGPEPAPTSLAPGEVYRYERRIYVGARGDVASSAEPALVAFAARTDLPMGSFQGRIQSADGSPFRASVVVTQLDLDPATPEPTTIATSAGGGAAPMPILQLRTDAVQAGHFASALPSGRYELRIEAEERDAVGPIAFTVETGAKTDLGAFTLSDNGTLLFEVREDGTLVPARITLKGMTVPDPALGPPVDLTMGGVRQWIASRAALPSFNTTYTSSGDGQLRLKPGTYRVIASRGPEYTMAWQDVVIPALGTATASIALERVVDTSGWLGADFHVHASPSADSSVPPRDRVTTLVGEGVEVMVSADHDVLFDYAPVVAEAGLGGFLTSIVGTELTSSQGPPPFGDGFGHVNGWPLPVDPIARKNGAPEDDGVEPNVLYDRLRALGAEVVQLNHPLTDRLGFLATLGYDPAEPLDIAPNNFLLRESVLGTGTRNLDLDALEIMNGLQMTEYHAARDVWFSFLDQGHPMTATAASDTHRVAVVSPGYPRTWVRSDDTLPGFDAAGFNASLRAMRAIGSSGPFLEAELIGDAGSAGIGETLAYGGGTVQLHVRVQAPCWMPVGDVRVFANGQLLLATAIDGTPCTTALRYEGSFDVTPSADTYFVVETEERIPRVTGTFTQQLATYVHRSLRFLAFTNPLFVDTDGNGVFDPPGHAP